MSLTYLVAAHHQPELFGRLVDRVGRSGDVVVHIDAKSDERAFRRAAPHAAFTRERVNVTWGGFSNVTMILALLREGLKASSTATHLIHLSGVDYPARPAEHLQRLLAEDPSRSYLNFYRVVPGSKFFHLTKGFEFTDSLSRVPASVRPRLGALVRRAAPRILDSEFPASLPPFRGSISSCLSREAAEYVVEFMESAEGRQLTRRLRTMLLPDEFVIQTILCNSPLRHSLAGWPEDDSTGIREDNQNDVYLHHIDWSPEREDPAILTHDDLSPIRASGKYFARKMERVRSAELLTALDEDCGFEPWTGV